MATHPEPANQTRRRVQRALTPLLAVVAIIVVLLEATVWRWLTALGQVLARLAIFAALERLVERLSPGAVVAVFVVPFIPIIPLLKLGELWLIQHHHFVWAAIVIAGTKVVGAAFSTRVFAIARPKMLQIHWFARLYTGTVWLLDLGHQALERLPGWAATRTIARRLLQVARSAVTAAGSFLLAKLSAGGAGTPGRRLAAAIRKMRRQPPR